MDMTLKVFLRFHTKTNVFISVFVFSFILLFVFHFKCPVLIDDFVERTGLEPNIELSFSTHFTIEPLSFCY